MPIGFQPDSFRCTSQARRIDSLDLLAIWRTFPSLMSDSGRSRGDTEKSYNFSHHLVITSACQRRCFGFSLFQYRPSAIIPPFTMGYTLIIDNYDSFTWNIYADIATLGGNPLVRRNDKITMDEIEVSDMLLAT